MVLKPIETQYRGYRFRSRLEARWAVFFDALGIKWEYETEGYDLGEAGWYLPDFWLPEIGWFVEVKPTGEITDKEQQKINALDDSPPVNAMGVMVMKGPPAIPTLWDDPIATDESACCTSYLLTWIDIDNENWTLIETAVNAARSARFEHGETP